MVRAIDAQQVILQTSALEKIQQVQQQQAHIQQNYIELQLKEEQKLARETVQYSSKTEKAAIKDRENEKNKPPRNKLGLEKKMNDAIEGEEEIETEGKGKFINIKV